MMRYGMQYKIDYSVKLNREFLRSGAFKLKRLGFKPLQIYRGIGILLGYDGAVYSTSNSVIPYTDKEGYMYFLFKSYMKPESFYLVKIKEDDTDWICECQSYFSDQAYNIKTAISKGTTDAHKLALIRGKCKHIAAAIILKDYLYHIYKI